jgi:nucleoside-diphosphate kinase
MERTFAMIKPDGMKHRNEILKRINSAGLKIIRSNITNVKQELAAEFYKHVKIKFGENIYQSLISYITEGEIMPMLLEGDNAVKKLRKITGFTDPERAEKGTIRGDLGTDKMRIADSEQRSTRNIIHASGSAEEAEKEIKFFFP